MSPKIDLRCGINVKKAMEFFMLVDASIIRRYA